MEKKTKHLRIRVTEEQFRKLADLLIEEQKNKSSLVRDILNKYIDENNINKIVKQNMKW